MDENSNVIQFSSDLEMLWYVHNNFTGKASLVANNLLAMPFLDGRKGYTIHFGYAHVFTVTSWGSFLLNKVVTETLDEAQKRFLNNLLQQMDFYTVTTVHFGYDVIDPQFVSWRTAQAVSHYGSSEFAQQNIINRVSIQI